jgi:2-oxoglutarate ferredoxin oxidoreductase subunit alpha
MMNSSRELSGMSVDSLSIAIVGSGGAGVMTTGQMLLDAAAKAGWFGLMTRSFGPQIRGGEAAAFVTLSVQPVEAPSDTLDLLVAIDWQNIGRFIEELPLTSHSLVLSDPEQGEVPPVVMAKWPKVRLFPLKELAKKIPDGRANMIALGALGHLAGLPGESLNAVASRAMKRKGPEALAATLAAFELGATTASEWNEARPLTAPAARAESLTRWNISGNEAAGLGALRAGVRFCAAYPITPATDILEWLAPRLGRNGGALVQAEDELASINMCLGASFGGVPSITATSGPGLALMAEALGLAVASETPVVVVNVMRGGPSTGIPTKAEQADLDIALYGLHGDAPHLVLAPNSIADCLATTQWAVSLAEGLQTPAIILSDQTLGQARAVIDAPAARSWKADRLLPDPSTAITAGTDKVRYPRYALTQSGVSPAPVPGVPGFEHVAEGLEHGENGLPSTRAADHRTQLDKRQRKLTQYDYGDFWAEVEGEGEVAILTWGSCTGPARMALAELARKGIRARLISLRLLLPAQPERLVQALAGVRKVLVLEMSHSRQFYRYLRAWYSLPESVTLHARPGPLPMRAGEIIEHLSACLGSAPGA